MRSPRRYRTGGAVLASALILALGVAPMLVFGADHLDAPALTPPSLRADADINDLFVFQGQDPSRTAIAVTTHPAAGAIAPLTYATDVDYLVNVDRNGDAVQDLAFLLEFGAPAPDGSQRYTVTRYTGINARTLNKGNVRGRGTTGTVGSLKGNGKIFVGLRSDPFFFDLGAFLGVVVGADNGRTFCDQEGGAGIDFFEVLNSNAIVIEMPDDSLGGQIGVWAATMAADGSQIDRMGRPAINTALIGTEKKNAFNAGHPADDPAAFGDEVASRLQALSAGDGEGAYSADQAAVLAGVLLPDVLTYDTSTPAAGPLNGRGLADDVIDVELNLVTGGFPFEGRDGAGAIGTDCVGPHTDLLSAFPYLGMPH